MQNTPSFSRQRTVVVASVLLLHIAALWALQSGLLQRAVVAAQELVVPVAVITDVPPQRKVELAKASLPDKAPTQTSHAPVATPATVPAPAAPAPALLAIADATPAPNAPAGAVVPQAVSPAAAPVPVSVATPVPPKVELPSSFADYLHNPKPKYPRLSQSRNEQGTVILSVLVGVDGKVREVAVKSSSGFDLLDRTAREAVLGWTFVPGKRNGAPVEMAVDVPIPFRLTD